MSVHIERRVETIPPSDLDLVGPTMFISYFQFFVAYDIYFKNINN